MVFVEDDLSPAEVQVVQRLLIPWHRDEIVEIGSGDGVFCRNGIHSLQSVDLFIGDLFHFLRHPGVSNFLPEFVDLSQIRILFRCLPLSSDGRTKGMILLKFPCLFSRIEQGMRSGRGGLDLSIEMMEDLFQSFQGIDGLKNFLLFLQSQMKGNGDQVSESPRMINLVERFQYLFGKGLPYRE